MPTAITAGRKDITPGTVRKQNTVPSAKRKNTALTRVDVQHSEARFVMREEGRKYTHNGEAQYSTDGGEKPKAYRNAAETDTIKKKNVLVWQVNTDRARATHDLIHALARTNNVDVVVYNQSNKKMAARHKWCINRRVYVAHNKARS